MEEKTKSVAQYSIGLGAITAVVMIIYSLLMYILDLHLNTAVAILQYVFLVAGMVWGILQYRKQILHGYISYGKSFSVGFLVAFFAVIILSVYVFIFYMYIAPDAINDLKDLAMEKTMNSNPSITDEQLEQVMQMQAPFYKPWALSLIILVQMTVVSAIISLILSIFLKKEDQSLDATR